MDYGKFLYQMKKREKEARKHQKAVKELRLRPQTDKHDLEFKTRNAAEFLHDGHKVRVFMILRGREMAHMDVARAKMEEIIEMLSDVAHVESPPKLQGHQLVMVLAPKREVTQTAERVKEGHEEEHKPESHGTDEAVDEASSNAPNATEVDAASQS